MLPLLPHAALPAWRPGAGVLHLPQHTTQVELVPTRTYRVGAATATCVFTYEAPTASARPRPPVCSRTMCGSPCSNRLMVTLQGEVYLTQAYSHQEVCGCDLIVIPPSSLHAVDGMPTVTRVHAVL